MVVCARPGVLRRVRAEDFSGFACGDIRYGHVDTVNVGDAEITKLQESVTKPHVVACKSALECVQLAHAAASAGTFMDSAIGAPNICKAWVHIHQSHKTIHTVAGTKS